MDNNDKSKLGERVDPRQMRMTHPDGVLPPPALKVDAPPVTQSPDAYLEDVKNDTFQPPPPQPKPQPAVAPQQAQTAESTTNDVTKKTFSSNMQRVLQAFGLKSVQTALLKIADGFEITIRPLSKEDYIWAVDRSTENKIGLGNLEIAEETYTAAVAAICIAAINNEPIYSALGILTEEEATAWPVTDKMYPPATIRERCAAMLYDMFMGRNGESDTIFLPGVAETIAVAWQEKIEKKVDGIQAPLVSMRRTFRGLPPEGTKSKLEGELQLKSEQPSAIQESKMQT